MKMNSFQVHRNILMINEQNFQRNYLLDSQKSVSPKMNNFHSCMKVLQRRIFLDERPEKYAQCSKTKNIVKLIYLFLYFTKISSNTTHSNKSNQFQRAKNCTFLDFISHCDMLKSFFKCIQHIKHLHIVYSATDEGIV